MDLAVPIFLEDKIYDSVEIKKPRAGVIADTYEIAQRGNVYRAFLEFISGCVENIFAQDVTIDTPAAVKRLCGSMPYISAEAVALKVLAEINKEDTVEGVYNCPRCQAQITAELDPMTEVDTRDKISELTVVCMDISERENLIPVTLEESVKLKNSRTGEIIQEIREFAIRYPTLNDCIQASQNMRPGQEVRVQIKIYINSLVTVNGEPVDKKWKATWGKVLFDNLLSADLKPISDALQKYGLDKMVERNCYDCGKVWRAPINTSNFFVSGLQPT